MIVSLNPKQITTVIEAMVLRQAPPGVRDGEWLKRQALLERLRVIRKGGDGLPRKRVNAMVPNPGRWA